MSSKPSPEDIRLAAITLNLDFNSFIAGTILAIDDTEHMIAISPKAQQNLSIWKKFEESVSDLTHGDNVSVVTIQTTNQ